MSREKFRGSLITVWTATGIEVAWT